MLYKACKLGCVQKSSTYKIQKQTAATKPAARLELLIYRNATSGTNREEKFCSASAYVTKQSWVSSF